MSGYVEQQITIAYDSLLKEDTLEGNYLEESISERLVTPLVPCRVPYHTKNDAYVHLRVRIHS